MPGHNCDIIDACLGGLFVTIIYRNKTVVHERFYLSWNDNERDQSG